jgi:hypothetical protein
VWATSERLVWSFSLLFVMIGRVMMLRWMEVPSPCPASRGATRGRLVGADADADDKDDKKNMVVVVMMMMTTTTAIIPGRNL